MPNFSNAVRSFKELFSDYVEGVCKGMSVPEKKLISDLLFGVLKGGDVLVSDIARALKGKRRLDYVEIRLTRGMAGFDYGKLDEGIQERVFRIFSEP